MPGVGLVNPFKLFKLSKTQFKCFLDQKSFKISSKLAILHTSGYQQPSSTVFFWFWKKYNKLWKNRNSRVPKNSCRVFVSPWHPHPLPFSRPQAPRTSRASTRGSPERRVVPEAAPECLRVLGTCLIIPRTILKKNENLNLYSDNMNYKEAFTLEFVNSAQCNKFNQ